MTSHLITPVNSMDLSIDFYSKLNFKIIESDDRAFAISKGLTIEINPSRYIRPGIRFYNENWNDILPELRKITAITETTEGHLLSDLNGTWIYLSTPENNNLTIEESDIIPVLGNYAGLSFEMTDIDKTLSIYRCLGFKESAGSVDQGWMTITGADNMTISLMKPNACPHLFFNPSMTFFNGENNIQIIENIRKTGLAFAEEITYFNKEGIVDNVILRDPGGYGFFIFSD